MTEFTLKILFANLIAFIKKSNDFAAIVPDYRTGSSRHCPVLYAPDANIVINLDKHDIRIDGLSNSDPVVLYDPPADDCPNQANWQSYYWISNIKEIDPSSEHDPRLWSNNPPNVAGRLWLAGGCLKTEELVVYPMNSKVHRYSLIGGGRNKALASLMLFRGKMASNYVTLHLKKFPLDDDDEGTTIELRPRPGSNSIYLQLDNYPVSPTGTGPGAHFTKYAVINPAAGDADPERHGDEDVCESAPHLIPTNRSQYYKRVPREGDSVTILPFPITSPDLPEECFPTRG